jgi:hypothetical protein
MNRPRKPHEILRETGHGIERACSRCHDWMPQREPFYSQRAARQWESPDDIHWQAACQECERKRTRDRYREKHPEAERRDYRVRPAERAAADVAIGPCLLQQVWSTAQPQESAE